MKLTIDRSLCDHALPACERCFARFIENPYSTDRHCITEFVEDGSELMHLTLHYDGRSVEMILTPEERRLVANLGWSDFVPIMPKFYRVKQNG